MSEHLSRVAEARIADAPQPPQRYGLSVFLRKAYPAVGHGAWDMGHGEPRVRGADVRHAGWDELPAELSALVQRRAHEDPVIASQLASRKGFSVLRLGSTGELSIQQRLVNVTFLDVPPRTTLTVKEYPETVSVYGYSSAQESGSVSAGIVLLRLGEAARVRWLAGTTGAPGFSFVDRLALLERGSSLEHHGASVALDALRENFHVVLAGVGATARIHTLFVGAGTNQFDLGVTAEHRAPHTTSDLRAKGVLTGKAQGVYRGLVRVERHATKSDGYQRCDTLLLSKTAEVDPIPNLEIETNDVRCTHGVTVSHVDPEHLFYLQSRGLGEGAARDLLVEGFVGSMLRAYPMADRERLQNAVRVTLADDADFTVLRHTVKQ